MAGLADRVARIGLFCAARFCGSGLLSAAPGTWPLPRREPGESRQVTAAFPVFYPLGARQMLAIGETALALPR